MKKKIMAALCLAMVCMISACGTDSTDSSESEVEKTQEILEEETTEEEIIEAETTSVEAETTGEESVNIGDQVEVNSEYGDFLLTIDCVRKCDWVERSEGESDKYVAVLVECDFDNISYDDPYNNDVWLELLLNVEDDEGYIVSVLDYNYDDGLYSYGEEIPVGSKGRLFVPYLCDVNVTGLTIHINGQYFVETKVDEEGEPETETERVEEEEEISEEDEDTVENTEKSEYFVAQGTTALYPFLEACEDNGYSITHPDRHDAYVYANAVGSDGTYSIVYYVEDQRVYNVRVIIDDGDDLTDGYRNCIIGMAKSINTNLDDDTIEKAIEEATNNPETQIVDSDTMFRYDLSKNEFSISY